MTADMELYDLEGGLDELRSWCAYQRNLPENERAKLGNAFPTRLLTKNGYVITVKKIPKEQH